MSSRKSHPHLFRDRKWDRHCALIIAGIYAAFGLAWIEFSDMAVEFLYKDFYQLSQAQTIKGVFFILFTALLLYFLIKKTTLELDSQKRGVRRLIESLPVAAMIVSNGNEGTVEHINRRFTELLGYTGDDFILPSDWWPLAYPDQDEQKVVREAWERNMSRCVAGYEGELPAPEAKVTDKSGNVHVIDFRHVCIMDKSLVLLHDVTQLRRSEEDLKRSEEKYRNLMECSADAIIIADPRTRMIEEVNSQAEKLFGKNKNELIGMDGALLYSDRSRDESIREFDNLVATGKPKEHLELSILGAGGKPVAASISASVFTLGDRRMVQGVFRNVDEQRRMEDKVRETENLVANIVDSTPMGVLLYRVDEDENLVLIRSNPAAEKMTKIKSAAMAGEKLEESFPALKGTEIPEIFRNVSRTGESWQNSCFKYKDDNLSGVYDVFCFQVLQDVVAVMLNDISGRLDMEEQLRQAQRLEALGQLAGGVAHDFNNQLAGIMGYAELLLMRLKDEKNIHCAKGILEVSHRTAALTQQLLTFARKGNFVSLPFELHNIIGDVVSLMSHSIDKRIAIRQQLSADSQVIKGDAGLVQNAILNLALNARDAMPNGGELVIATSNGEFSEDDPRRPDPLAPGKFVKLEVSDTGEGIPPEIIERIFEPFFTTKEVGKGTGMGLASVYGTVKTHHGSIAVESKAGEGTTVTVYLPAHRGKVKKTDGEEAAAYAGSASILIVDDEQIVRDTVSELLADVGYHTHPCSGGKDAVDYFQENWQSTDLILLDMVMPDLSGEDVFASLRMIQPDIKILICSGFSTNNRINNLITDNNVGFIKKPFRSSVLVKAVSDMLQGRTPAV